MELEECKARILYGQHLTNGADTITVCRDLNGVQAQFMSAALHALSVRSAVPLLDSKQAVVQGLVKNWTIRGTVHIFAEVDLPLYLHKNRTHYLRPVDQMLEDEYISLERKQLFADYILECIGQGIGEREALKQCCFERGMTERECESVFNSWGGTIRYLAETGKICHEVSEKKAFRLCPEFTPMEEDAARLEMARRYFLNFGPVMIKDAAYYFGVSQRQVKKWIVQLPVSVVMVEGKERFLILQDCPHLPEIPECIFLAGFDQLMLGYEKKESLFLPSEYLRGIFNLSGIVMPAILLRGTVVGRWKRKGAALEFTAFRTLKKDEKCMILDAAERQWPEVRRVVWDR